ncbi:hypothetical protein DFH07DRAFT_944295 [Mycena maculata]|uniref:Uncharacterized protein n=1 Tax=Mycena maculata TaxID=230809 RepID=A0AAD7MZ55_9AGAR|nr:hypothetical protein DFH07DRAFT_944295 [Mycena maculata]
MLIPPSSRCPGAVPAPAAHRSGWVAHPDHYRHLESLLDSALATLALLHESHTAPTPLAFSSHMFEVLLALNMYIVVNQAVHPAPTPATTTTEPSAEAHIAQTATLSLRTGANNRVRSRASRLIICFDPTDPIPPKRADTLELYAAIANVLPKHAYHLARVSWTRKGNLVLHARSGVCTAKLLAAHEVQIWGALRPRLGFSTKKTPPKFEIDEPWCTIVIHGAPNHSPDAITLASVQYWFGTNELSGTVMAYSILCTADDLKTHDSLSVRISLSSEADTLHLVKNGGTFFGAMCRVSRYVPNKAYHECTRG